VGNSRDGNRTRLGRNKWSFQDQFYTPTHTRSAISNLIRFSAAMFVLPLLTIDYFDLPPDRAMLYAGICGISVVFVIVAAFVYVAYREEQEDEKVKLSAKKSD
ncbi:unnamed protein product, partial [Heligmosomoides polygyrus]|uniref:Vacuolar ATPase assembly integral membrane protein VMA21 homolog n=1 Tax=Heligmosomoides polygyrus TaxID=6339 RepID=A0A183GPB7_HELPZ